jgi:hypothetical protein
MSQGDGMVASTIVGEAGRRGAQAGTRSVEDTKIETAVTVSSQSPGYGVAVPRGTVVPSSANCSRSTDGGTTRVLPVRTRTILQSN